MARFEFDPVTRAKLDGLYRRYNTREEEALRAAMAKRREDMLHRAFYGDRVRASCPDGIEVITDAADPRGRDAKRVEGVER